MWLHYTLIIFGSISFDNDRNYDGDDDVDDDTPDDLQLKTSF